MAQKSTRHDCEYVFDQMLALLSRGWHQGFYACDSEGDAIVPQSKAAVKFDISGALLHIVYAKPQVTKVLSFVRFALLQAFHRTFPERQIFIDDLPKYLSEFNDTPNRTKEEVLAFLKLAKEISNGNRH